MTLVVKYILYFINIVNYIYNYYYIIDEETINKVSEILKTQFDVEIYLKRREIWAIENEIEKGETVLQNLRDALLNGKYVPNKGKFLLKYRFYNLLYYIVRIR